MLKILQARLQQYVNCELPDVQAGFKKGRGTRDKIVNIHWIIKKAREFQKNIYFCFIHYAKAFDYVDHNKLQKILKETFFGGWGAPKSLQMVTAAMKLKDAYSWKESYDKPRQHIKKQRHYFANKGPSGQNYGFSSGHVWM